VQSGTVIVRVMPVRLFFFLVASVERERRVASTLTGFTGAYVIQLSGGYN
jgi:hypothetical protein